MNLADHEDVKKGMMLARECAHKLAQPANWFALQAHLENLVRHNLALQQRLSTVQDRFSRLQYPDTTGS